MLTLPPIALRLPICAETGRPGHGPVGFDYRFRRHHASLRLLGCLVDSENLRGGTVRIPIASEGTWHASLEHCGSGKLRCLASDTATSRRACLVSMSCEIADQSLLVGTLQILCRSGWIPITTPNRELLASSLEAVWWSVSWPSIQSTTHSALEWVRTLTPVALECAVPRDTLSGSGGAASYL